MGWVPWGGVGVLLTSPSLRRSLLEALRILSPEGLILAAPASITQRRLAPREVPMKHLQGTPAVFARSHYNVALEGSIT